MSRITRLEWAVLALFMLTLIWLTFTASPKHNTLCPCPEVSHAQS